MIGKGKCFDCTWLSEPELHKHCTHINAIRWKELDKKCLCGRTNSKKHGGCGRCTGRGKYCYPNSYDKCDCGGYMKNTNKN